MNNVIITLRLWVCLDAHACAPVCRPRTKQWDCQSEWFITKMQTSRIMLVCFVTANTLAFCLFFANIFLETCIIQNSPISRSSVPPKNSEVGRVRSLWMSQLSITIILDTDIHERRGVISPHGFGRSRSKIREAPLVQPSDEAGGWQWSMSGQKIPWWGQKQSQREQLGLIQADTVSPLSRATLWGHFPLWLKDLPLGLSPKNHNWIRSLPCHITKSWLWDVNVCMNSGAKSCSNYSGLQAQNLQSFSQWDILQSQWSCSHVNRICFFFQYYPFLVMWLWGGINLEKFLLYHCYLFTQHCLEHFPNCSPF